MTSKTAASECQVLIAGAGPAGLATAITAIRNGARPLVIERHPGTSIYPRATGVHLRTVELLRSWGLHHRVRGLDVRVRPLRSVSPTLRDASPLPLGYPTDPRQMLTVSPALPVLCPQDSLEPMLLEHLESLGGEVRFGVELTDLIDDGSGITATLRERTSSVTSTVRARFVVGADGTRSTVRQALRIPTERLGDAGEWLYILFKSNLDPMLGDRRYPLYAITHPEASGLLVRIGNDRWGFARQWFPDRGESPADYTPDRCIQLLRKAIGDPDAVVHPRARMPFTMVAEVARTFRKGNGFLVGDAAHRMTPAGALGMNTAIQSAHNLGWKLAWAARGWADDTLLDSYDAERRPAGERNARLSLQLREQPPMADGWIADLNHTYGSAVIAAAAPRRDGPHPGQRAPHAWVTTGGRRRSLLDLYDSRLTLVVGPDAEPWRHAAAASPVPLQVLGAGREIQCDPDRLALLYGLTNGGAVLVRPDGHISWNSICTTDPVTHLLAGIDLTLGRGHTALAAA